MDFGNRIKFVFDLISTERQILSHTHTLKTRFSTTHKKIKPEDKSLGFYFYVMTVFLQNVKILL